MTDEKLKTLEEILQYRGFTYRLVKGEAIKWITHSGGDPNRVNWLEFFNITAEDLK